MPEIIRPSTAQLRLGRRSILWSATAAALGLLATRIRGASAQATGVPSDEMEVKQYDPPRGFAMGTRVGNLLFLAGEDGKIWNSGTDWSFPPGGIEAQAEQLWQNVEHSLAAFGTDLDHAVRFTTYYTNMERDQPIFSQVRRRHVGRSVPGTALQISSLSDPENLVEVDVIAIIPSR
jgi:enamine deaminase RidA (YjgF/YER057c/UK114 family)